MSLLLAFLIWFQVSGQQTIQRTLFLPVEFVNMPPNLEISNDYAKNVEVFVRAQRSAALGEGNLAVVVNLRAAIAGTEVVPLSDQNIRNKPSGMEVLQITPPTLRLELENTLRKIVEVTPNIMGSPAQGFQLTRVDVAPGNVMVSGPESRVQKVSAVQTEPIHIGGMTSTLTRNAYLEVEDPRLRIENAASVKIVATIEEQRRETRIRGIPVRVIPPDTSVRLASQAVDVVGTLPISFRGQLEKEGFQVVVEVANLEPREEPYVLAPRITIPEKYRELFRVKSIHPERVSATKR